MPSQCELAVRPVFKKENTTIVKQIMSTHEHIFKSAGPVLVGKGAYANCALYAVLQYCCYHTFSCHTRDGMPIDHTFKHAHQTNFLSSTSLVFGVAPKMEYRSPAGGAPEYLLVQKKWKNHESVCHVAQKGMRNLHSPSNLRPDVCRHGAILKHVQTHGCTSNKHSHTPR